MMYYNLANMTYCNMTNKELLDAYNASAEYDVMNDMELRGWV